MFFVNLLARVTTGKLEVDSGLRITLLTPGVPE